MAPKVGIFYSLPFSSLSFWLSKLAHVSSSSLALRQPIVSISSINPSASVCQARGWPDRLYHCWQRKQGLISNYFVYETDFIILVTYLVVCAFCRIFTVPVLWNLCPFTPWIIQMSVVRSHNYCFLCFSYSADTFVIRHGSMARDLCTLSLFELSWPDGRS